ncbi:TetR/AcrR family transcriptional regulator [Bradyrhizobium lablabi]|uniref:TetR/AcrR family transcriptional regulator n=1 Tax=Bradyrhizobium lablabi TaxID=722472 RepID=UPI001BA4BF80|nr:TetR/AcrR family transcriptional regulator [Bradyrhizobium lablabi]MBR0691896.1 TetR/AcrR family transcriptional regulator [Bradyrhizobium lablabi]
MNVNIEMGTEEGSLGFLVVKIDRARRAEIGRARSARTREQLLGAARSLYAKQAVESVTVEDVVREAGVAKGTLYVHFKNIEAVQMAVADELTETFVDLLQPRRAIFDPVERIADGCYTFLHQAAVNPKWGGLVARYAWSFPTVGSKARGLLADDLHQAARKGRISEISPDLGTAIVVGIVLQVMRSASEGNLRSSDMPSAVVAILRSLGVSGREATRAVKHIVRDSNKGQAQ